MLGVFHTEERKESPTKRKKHISFAGVKVGSGEARSLRNWSQNGVHCGRPDANKKRVSREEQVIVGTAFSGQPTH